MASTYQLLAYARLIGLGERFLNSAVGGGAADAADDVDGCGGYR